MSYKTENLDLVAPPIPYYSTKSKEVFIIAHTPSYGWTDSSSASYRSDMLTSCTISKGRENHVRDKAARATLQARVNSYSTLTKGWDGHRANPIGQQCIENVEKIINSISLTLINEINVNDIFPTPNGTITIEVSRGKDSYFVLDIGNERVMYYYRNGDDLEGLDESSEFNDETITSVCSLFNEFLQVVDRETTIGSSSW